MKHYLVIHLASLLFSGAAEAQIVLHVFSGSRGASAGDANGDGTPDIAIANGDAVSLLSGKTWRTLSVLRKPTTGSALIFGLAGGTDINQDGFEAGFGWGGSRARDL